MKFPTAAILTMMTFVPLQSYSQQPEAIPVPPANESNIKERDASPAIETNGIETNTQETPDGPASILLKTETVEDLATSLPDETISESTLILEPISEVTTSKEPGGNSLSSSIDGIQTPVNDSTISHEWNEDISTVPSVPGSTTVVPSSPPHASVITDDPFREPHIIQTPQFESASAVIYAPQPALYRQTIYRQTTTRRIPQQPRRVAKTITETTTYRTPQPSTVPLGSSYGRVPQSIGSRQAFVVSPSIYPAVAGARGGHAQPRIPRAIRFGSPIAVVVPAQVIGGPVLGPAGQVPMPRTIVPGQPVRNFVRGIGPY